jgi:DNA-binding GntR family transcriptional regulator
MRRTHARNPTRLLLPATAKRPEASTLAIEHSPSWIIEHENLEEKIYARLRALIVDRSIPPGGRLVVDRLARRMGVSRTPVLGALKRLSLEGVVELKSRRGIYVRRFTKREMVQLFQVREVLEGLSARLAAPHIDRAEVDRLAEMFRRLSVAPTPAAVRRYIEQDRYFHWRIVQLARNQQIAHALESVNMMFFTWQDGLVRPAAETVQEHFAVLEALRRQDPNVSEATMRLHIRRSAERLEQEADVEEPRAP